MIAASKFLQRLRRTSVVAACALTLASLALMSLSPAGSPALAQDNMMRPAAIVNDDVISVFDLAQRTRLAVLASGIRPTPEAIDRLQSQVLRALIDESLQIQEAERNGIEVSQDEVNSGVERLARQNNFSREQFLRILEENGVGRQTLEEQFRARLAWQKLVRAKVGREIDITEEDIDDELARIQASVGKPEWRVSEIFLAVDDPADEEEVRTTAERLVRQLGEGAPFQALARQFSQSVTAAVGGDMDWVQEGDLPQDLEQVVTTMQPGEVAGPIRGFGGYYILGLRNKRQVSLGNAGGGDVTLQVKQVFLPLESTASNQQVADIERTLGLVRQEATSCDAMDGVAEKYGGTGSGDMGSVSLDELPQPIADALRNLPEGQLSRPVRVGAGVTVLMVCGRDEGGSGSEREAIQLSLMNEQLNARARRYMRDLRRDAFVDIRI